MKPISFTRAVKYAATDEDGDDHFIPGDLTSIQIEDGEVVYPADPRFNDLRKMIFGDRQRRRFGHEKRGQRRLERKLRERRADAEREAP